MFSSITFLTNKTQPFVPKVFTNELLDKLWSSRPKGGHGNELIQDYFQCLTGKFFSSQRSKIDNWINEILLAIESLQDEGKLIDLLSGEKQQPSSIRRWLNRISGRVVDIAEEASKKQENALKNLLKNIGFSNTLSILVRGYQLARQLRENEGIDWQKSEKIEKIFENLLHQLAHQCDINPTNLTFDKKEVSSEFLIRLEHTNSNNKRRNQLIGGVALAALGIAFACAYNGYASYNYFRPEQLLQGQDNPLIMQPNQEIRQSLHQFNAHSDANKLQQLHQTNLAQDPDIAKTVSVIATTDSFDIFDPLKGHQTATLVNSIPTVLSLRQTNNVPVTSYRNNENLEIPRNIDDGEIRDLIKEMVQNGDKEAIIELICLLNDKNSFPNIDNWHLWEIDIQDALIDKRDLQLIRNIFPLFKKQTLSYTNKYYEPIVFGDLELVQAMYEGGMLLSKDNEDRYNAVDVFLYSIAYGRYDIAKYFIEHAGYDINKPYSVSLQCVEDHKYAQLAQVMAGDRITAAYMASAMNSPEALKEIIALGANCNSANIRPNEADKYRSSDDDSDTPLIKAIKKGSEECFRILIEAPNIDLNVKGNMGRSPLLVAATKKRFGIVQTLIDRGVDLNVADSAGYTALMFTVFRGDLSTTKTLLEREANPRCTDNHGKNLWHIASRNSKPAEFFSLLKDKIPDLIDEENEFGKSALFQAVEEKKPESVKHLIENGASLRKIARNLSEYTKEELNLKKDQEVDIHAFARAVLNKLNKDLNGSKHRKEQLQNIKLMEEIIAILANSHPVVSEKIADPILPKPVQNAWDSELNNIQLSIGSAKEIEDKIHKMAPHCINEFVKKLAQKVANKVYNPKSLITALALNLELEYYDAGETAHGMKTLTLLSVPEILCAFSDDQKMQNHLKMLWKNLRNRV